MQISIRKYLLCVILSLLLLAGLNCSRYTFSMIYNQIDYLLYLEVDKYFALDEKQKEFVKQKLASLLEWNKETALPRYREILIYMKNSEENGITVENINYIYNMFDKEIDIIMEKTALDAAEFVLTLNDEQIENFQKEVIKHRQEEEEKYASHSKDPVERRTQSRTRFLSRFYGEFSTEQIEEIKGYLINNNCPRYDRREYQDIEQNRFIDLINKRADKATVSGFIKNWLTRKDISLPDSYREKLQAQRRFNTGLYVYVD
ncbi:DUF6279 family lipoprotein [Thermodesulfobacteriota bacterium]